MFDAINLKKWIEENKNSLKPPVGNKQIWENREFIVMMVGGPNQREDYHINQGEEFFYQIRGDIELKILRDGQPDVVQIREGEVYLLPPKVPHSPQRPENTLGIVVERQRAENERDGFLWICHECNQPLYKAEVHVKNIQHDLPPVLESFYSNADRQKCHHCGLDNRYYQDPKNTLRS